MDRPHRVLGDYYQLLQKNALLSDDAPLKADLSCPVPLVSCDSQVTVPGTLFICKGAAFKEEYLREALAKGAVAYVSQQPYPEAPGPCIQVTNIRLAMALLADAAWGHPSGSLTVTGITGTKGKTTTAYFLRSILDLWRGELGRPRTALLSTIIADDGVECRSAKLTTPEPLDLQRHLFHALQAGCDYMTMEVSSQALKYHRVAGLDLNCAVFLNIGEDHISPIEHPDLEDYFTSKLKIFDRAQAAVINADCDQADRVAQAAQVCPRVVTFSRRDPSATLYASQLRKEGSRTLFHLRTPEWEGELALPIPGLFNVENALAAVGVCLVYGVPFSCIREGLAQSYVPGRMETYQSADGALTVIVDYSHNGMSLDTALSSIRQEYPNREVTVLFGCTGGKGLSRRPGMANAAARWADRVILTEDDPGPESVEEICADVGRYLTALGRRYTVLPDREEAVFSAILNARTPAVVLLAGKGAEQRQLRKDGPHPCVPDGMLARSALERYDRRRGS